MNPINHTTARTFGEFDNVFDLQMDPCVKTTLTFATQINEPFRVQTIEGDYKQGKPGDYLMQGVKGELYICDQEIFHQTYARLNSARVNTAYRNFVAAVNSASTRATPQEIGLIEHIAVEKSGLDLGLPTNGSPQVMFESIQISDSTKKDLG